MTNFVQCLEISKDLLGRPLAQVVRPRHQDHRAESTAQA
eukprot:CAMPEP_0118834340 /NCGR_PEP_ID=MMETSP1162-20130426/49282_1 /TAXON_ID=33656 /ORGANISM="Phaeocystis Sp, Strain CCMP2710" /LENGTH=38 /DNA_ID= /DNA_START= /DNA_END= /DNA_ORIENTATION=